MKKASKNEIELLSLVNKIQEQLVALDKKVDTLINRPSPETKLTPKPSINIASIPSKPHDHNQGRQMHSAVCADCNKECKIPFKPSGDRPVYCQDCFSRRKVISMSGVKFEDKSKAPTPPQAAVIKEATAAVKTKKKTTTVKKPVAKKKVTPKKK